MAKTNIKKEKSYYDKVHTWGRISTVSALCILLMFPMSICLYLGVFPSAKVVFEGLLKLIPLYWTVWLDWKIDKRVSLLEQRIKQ